MADQALPPSLAAMMREFDRRLRAIESASGLGNSAIDDGRLSIVKPGTGVTVGRLGEIDTGQTGMRVTTTAYAEVFKASAEQLWQFPLLPLPARLASARETVTSSTVVVAAAASHPLVPSKDVRVDVLVTTDAGTTAELYVRTQSTNTLTQTVAAATTTTLTWRWIHGREHTGTTFEVMCRRASGAGNIVVHVPDIQLGDVVGATLTGL